VRTKGGDVLDVEVREIGVPRTPVVDEKA